MARDGEEPGLRRRLGLPSLTLYGLGLILGAGIYSIIGEAAAEAGRGLWLAFLLGAAIALLTGLSYAELAAMFPKAGAEYTYAAEAFPRRPWLASSTGYVLLGAGLATAATVAAAFGGYLGVFLDWPSWVGAIAVLVAAGAVALAGIRESAWANAAMTALEVGGLLLVVWLAFRHADVAGAVGFAPPAGLAAAGALVFFAYLGFEDLANLAEEAREPERRVPQAILLSVAISALLYALVGAAAIALAGADRLAGSDSPLAEAAAEAGPGYGGALAAIALAATANTVLITLVALSRMLLAMARGGHAPKPMRAVMPRRGTRGRRPSWCWPAPPCSSRSATPAPSARWPRSPPCSPSPWSTSWPSRSASARPAASAPSAPRSPSAGCRSSPCLACWGRPRSRASSAGRRRWRGPPSRRSPSGSRSPSIGAPEGPGRRAPSPAAASRTGAPWPPRARAARSRDPGLRPWNPRAACSRANRGQLSMPELPEVETIRRGLATRLPGRRVEGVDFRPERRLRFPSPHPLAGLEGQRFAKPGRLGKFLLLRLASGATLLVHLGMTGKLTFHAPGEPERPHTHLVLALDDDSELRFSDPRRFGLLRLYAPGEPIPDLAGYGPDALSARFSAAHLRAALAGSRSPVKAALMDQSKVAGVGNIYACEALWRARIAPTRRADQVPAAKVGPLHDAIRAVLKESIGRGGTSFNDYVDHIGQPGQFVAELAVYGRKGLPCPRCGAKVRRTVQSNRSSFHCPRCQR